MDNSKRKINNIFAENLRLFMAFHDISQKQLAEEMGVQPASVSDWMHGISLPRKERMPKLCQILDIDEKLLFIDAKELYKSSDFIDKCNVLPDDDSSSCINLELYLEFLKQKGVPITDEMMEAVGAMGCAMDIYDIDPRQIEGIWDLDNYLHRFRELLENVDDSGRNRVLEYIEMISKNDYFRRNEWD